MFTKISLIGVTLLIAESISLYLLKSCKKRINLSKIADLYLNKEMSLEQAKRLIKRNTRKIEAQSYINAVLASVNACFAFVIPFIICSNSLFASKSIILCCIIIEGIMFLTAPKFYLNRHNELIDTLTEGNKECISILESEELKN